MLPDNSTGGTYLLQEGHPGDRGQVALDDGADDGQGGAGAALGQLGNACQLD